VPFVTNQQKIAQGDSPYELISTGIGLQLTTKMLKLEWNARERDVLPNRDPADMFSYLCPKEIIDLARPSLKSSVAFSATRSSQDSTTPTHGTMLHGRAEFAVPWLMGGDIGQVGLTVRASNAQPLFGGLVLILSGEASLVRSAFKSDVADDVPLVDRLFLGGPLHLRGFLPRGAGPRSRDGKAVLGGTARWQVRLGLESPPPVELPFALKSHLFLAAGALDDALDDPRVSLGAGVALPVPFGRFEINAVHVLRSKPGDGLGGRFQFGLGGEFL